MPVDPVVAEVFGYSVSIGIVVSILVQFLKMTETIPFLAKIPGVQALIDAIDHGKISQIQSTVAVLCVLANIGTIYYATGSLPPITIIIATFNSFLTSLGTYDFAIKRVEKLNK